MYTVMVKWTVIALKIDNSITESDLFNFKKALPLHFLSFYDFIKMQLESQILDYKRINKPFASGYRF
jgi:hypothetical protein